MIRFLRDVEISKLLGKKQIDINLDENFSHRIRSILSKAIKEEINDSNLPDDQVDFLLNIVEGESSSERQQIESLKLMPNLLKRIESEVYELKKNLVLEEAYSVTSNTHEQDPIQTTVRELKEILDSENDMKFESVWVLFIQQRDEVKNN